ncbi:MAG: hypothetical protein M3T56_10345 [Chloroflexota bacterium]|nr:hypothetical protein [Chloroflexota bacterium]
MEQLAIGFLLGVLTAGIGAVFQHQITTGARGRAIRRALLAEVEENVERIGPADRSRAPAAVERSAWNLARELTLPDEVLEKLRKAYAAGADLNSRIGIVDALLGAAVSVDPGSEAGRQFSRHQKATVDGSFDSANIARGHFEAARDALRRLA